MKYKYFQILILVATAIFAISPFSFCRDLVSVRKVIDGDTFALTSGERVRMIGVDTPETKHPKKTCPVLWERGLRVYQADDRVKDGCPGV